MVCGVLAQDHDITDLFIDATFKIIGRDYDEFALLLNKLSKVANETDTKIVFTVSEDEEKLPASVFEAAKKI